MEKRWLFIIGISIILLLAIIGFLGVTSTTGSVVYGKCWKMERPLEKDSELSLRMQGCVIEKDSQRVCCPFENCPNTGGLSCS